MSLVASFVDAIKQLQQVSRGDVMTDLTRVVADTLYSQANRGWDHRVSPHGEPWRSTAGGPVSMVQTGGLRRSLRVLTSPDGSIRLFVGPGKTFGRHSVASVQQYGGWTVSGYSKSGKRGAKVRAYERIKGSGKGLMIYKVNGQWRRGYSTVHNPNAMLPDGGRLPPAWEAALREVSTMVFRKWGK
jgi:hypothetical protein